MKTVYISGKITGTTDYEERFAKAGERLKLLGYDVVNPVEIGKEIETRKRSVGESEPSWRDYMVAALSVMMKACDTIYLLKGWQFSKGARLECHIANELGYGFMYEED